MRSVPMKACGVILVLSIFGGCARSPEARRDRYITHGNQYLQKHDYARAILEFKNAARATPDDAEVYYRLGLAFTGENDARLAVAAFQKAVALNPRHAGAQLRISQIMASTNDPGLLQDAQKRLKSLLDGDAPISDVLNSLALTELKLGQPEDAIRTLQRALAAVPGHMNSSVLLASVKLQQKDVKGAEEVLQKLCEQIPESADARRILGEFYVTQGRLADAGVQFQSALTLDPKSGAALNDLARLQLTQGKKGEAEQSFRKLSGFDGFHLIYGLFLFQENRRDEAIREFERVFKQFPDDREARTDLVVAYKAANRMADIDRVLAEAIKNNPRDADALLQRGEISMNRRDFAEAERDFNACQKLRPESSEVRYALAQMHQARGENLSYRQELSEALRLDPSRLAIRLELAQDYVRHKEGAAALDTLNAAPESQKKTTAFLVARNWALWTNGSLTEMRQGIDAGLSTTSPPDLLVQDGIWKLRNGNPSGARAALEQALQVNPSDVLALRALSRSYLVQKNDSLALEKVKEYAAHQPNSAPVQEFLGELLMANGRRSEARAALMAAKAASPQSVTADLSLVQLDVAEGKLDQAHERLASVAATHSSPVTDLWLGNIEELKGDQKSALEHFRKAAGANPADAEAANNLAYLMAESGGNLEEALKFAQKAVELAPDRPAYADTLGWILYRRGLYSSAVNYLEKANTKPQDAVWKYHLAMAYAKAGDLKRGRAMFDAALKLAPTAPEAELARNVVGISH